MNAALIFACSFAVVLALGLQQLNIQANLRAAAFMTSLAIASCNLMLYKLVPQPTGWLENAGFILGAGAGILSAMSLHPRLVMLTVELRRRREIRRLNRKLDREQREEERRAAITRRMRRVRPLDPAAPEVVTAARAMQTKRGQP